VYIDCGVDCIGVCPSVTTQVTFKIHRLLIIHIHVTMRTYDIKHQAAHSQTLYTETDNISINQNSSLVLKNRFYPDTIWMKLLYITEYAKLSLRCYLTPGIKIVLLQHLK